MGPKRELAGAGVAVPTSGPGKGHSARTRSGLPRGSSGSQSGLKQAGDNVAARTA